MGSGARCTLTPALAPEGRGRKPAPQLTDDTERSPRPRREREKTSAATHRRHQTVPSPQKGEGENKRRNSPTTPNGPLAPEERGKKPAPQLTDDTERSPRPGRAREKTSAATHRRHQTVPSPRKREGKNQRRNSPTTPNGPLDPEERGGKPAPQLTDDTERSPRPFGERVRVRGNPRANASTNPTTQRLPKRNAVSQIRLLQRNQRLLC